MIKNIDKFYEKAAGKIPAGTVHREESNTITNTVQQSSAEIIQEMLANECDYIGQLTTGIRTYLNHDVTEAMKETITKIFGNMQQIKDFHENTFYLNLSDCQNDVGKIANVFIKFTQVRNHKPDSIIDM